MPLVGMRAIEGYFILCGFKIVEIKQCALGLIWLGALYIVLSLLLNLGGKIVLIES